ncbi:pyridine nucleotide-disulfide oxidoreductase-domain-containing protein [Radiomyces spectabilis]|uniref:pyridine nucleotide-disulfide oxidoreductase-domain-containing protein n=1 Tax=Radiomyces spectabilis TaxID=64574 RepID=UPI00221EB5B4|nr:pyridine nucleotide-disulfide oxidoreductase-domain-containing protein [Radiomyces spectabilis]KAI8371367.1 pyridine nucleotide-disulfide oxidoreductase-domain-containing protein [Radiomyces spectabilis]
MYTRFSSRLPRLSASVRQFASATTKAPASKKRIFARRFFVWSGATAATGALVYTLLQDKEYIEDAQGAHEHVSELALHPPRGGEKNLPIVTDHLDQCKDNKEQKPRLVILGSGWGAVSVVKSMDTDKYDVTLISENNYFLFTPLLPSATVGTLELRSLLEPIRKIVRRIRGHYLEGTAVDLDINNKLVQVSGINGEEFYVPYDKLVIAVGATSITHGIEGIEHTMRLKTIHDAMEIRRKVTSNVEKACLPTTTPEERKRLLSFVVCGGGPTGIEFAAELFDWINEDLVKWFPKLIREEVAISIIQSRDHILNTFDSRISEYAEKRFERERINVYTNARVARIEEDKVVYKLKNSDPDNPTYNSIPCGLCLWSTGIAMTDFTRRLTEKLPVQAHKRVLMTDAFLHVRGVEDCSIYALGDCASIENPKLLDHIMDIFEAADENKDGTLSLEEFAKAVDHMRTRFPLTQQHLGKLMQLFKTYDADNSGTLDIDEMRKMLKDIDSKMTNLPATAQVANQQGTYLGKYLSQIAGQDENTVKHQYGPFQYRHLGTLAYLGNTAVGEFNWGYKMIGGLWAMYLWRSVYWSEQVSTRTRMNLSLDWTKRALWGRDISTV